MRRRMKRLWTELVPPLLSWMTPKKRGSVAVVSLQFEGQFAADGREMALHLARSAPDIDVFWVARDKEDVRRVREMGVRAVHSRWSWLLPINRAEYVMVDGIRGSLGLGRYRFLQLWHGTGFKNIGLLNTHRKGLRRLLVRWFNAKTEVVFAGSAEDGRRKQLALEINRAAVTGMPRSDALLRMGEGRPEVEDEEGPPDANEGATRAEEPEYRVLYAPTFRDTTMGKPPFTRSEWERLSEVMTKTNGVFMVKRHPSDELLEVPTNLRGIREVTSECEDIQELLARTDFLVTDYSSIVTDFVLTGRPVAFLHHDLEEYLDRNRSMYYPFPDILPGPFARSGTEIVDMLESGAWKTCGRERPGYRKFEGRFHRFRDGKAAERIEQEIRWLAGLPTSVRIASEGAKDGGPLATLGGEEEGVEAREPEVTKVA